MQNVFLNIFPMRNYRMSPVLANDRTLHEYYSLSVQHYVHLRSLPAVLLPSNMVPMGVHSLERVKGPLKSKK